MKKLSEIEWKKVHYLHNEVNVSEKDIVYDEKKNQYYMVSAVWASGRIELSPIDISYDKRRKLEPKF